MQSGNWIGSRDWELIATVPEPLSGNDGWRRIASPSFTRAHLLKRMGLQFG
jgi:hypothetical protein